jgi:hypothetical protein
LREGTDCSAVRFELPHAVSSLLGENELSTA